MTASRDDYRAAAKATYAEWKAAFLDEPKVFFWRSGHAFDSALDYFLEVDAGDAQAFAERAVAKYREGGGAWYDDFGWWGIAGERAALSNLFDGHDATFREIARECWDKMAGYAPFGWAKADQKRFADYRPLFDGGVWNHWIDEACNPGPTARDGLCGRQNTVTNALFLTLGQRLHLDPAFRDPAIWSLAEKEYGFLTSWFGLPDARLALLYAYGGPPVERAVVRERVGTFGPAAGKVTDAAYRPDLAWAGDQGLVLGALVARMRNLGEASPEYAAMLRLARRLIAGTQDYLVEADSGLLKPWTPEPAPGGDDDDYWTGPAVYLRYLLNAYRENASLEADLQNPAIRAFVEKNARAVIENPQRRQSGDTLVNRTNDLAFLVAAVAMLP